MTKSWESWLRQARRFVKSAELELSNGFHEIAYYLALHAGELALKTVLVKCGVFDEKEDKTHDMLKLLSKIENFNCLPSNVLIELSPIVESGAKRGLSHVDVATAEGLTIDCEAAMTSQIRYPIGDEAPYQYIDPSETQNKIELANSLITLLEKHFSL